MKGLCTNCFYVLDLQNGAFALCEVCQTEQLCTRCIVAEDIPMCLDCKKGQLIMCNEREAKRQVMDPCCICKTVWETMMCKECKQFYCVHCNGRDSHYCLRCDGNECDRNQQEKCCNKRWCYVCIYRHKQVDCEETMYRICKKCGVKVRMFGPEFMKCPVLGCHYQYGCTSIGCNRLVRYNWRGIYCEQHISPFNCPGCKNIYPLDPALKYGYARILQLLGAKIHRREYCGPCLERIRALVESVLIVLRRMGKPIGLINGFPKVLMDKIVLFSLDRLFLQSQEFNDPSNSIC